MLTKEQNDRLTKTGPGTPCGAFMRRYWTPAALSEELVADQPLPIRLLGEDLVLYRQADGTPALVERFCPHRGTDLSYGRLEDGGLRCLYHGWLFAPDGRCLEQPAEPRESTFKDKIRVSAYPCAERAGVILAYLGPLPAPPLPPLPFVACDPAQVWATKRFHECNYLQANDVDPAHLSFLHRFFDGTLARSKSNQYTSRDPQPVCEVEETEFGLRFYASRRTDEGDQYVRITNFVMPCGQAYVGSPLIDPKITPPSDDHGFWFHWHVPIDDETHWKYVFAYRADGPIDREFQASKFVGETTAGFHNVRNRENRYLQDRAEMTRSTYAGVGSSFQDQDRLAVETQGRLYDRTREHLGTSDRPLIEMRKMMFAAIDDVAAGRDPLGVVREPSPPFADFAVRSARIPAGADVRGFWRREMVAP